MSESFWRKINYIFGLFAVGMLFALVVFLTNIEIKDLDIWLHIGMGRFIMQNGFIPGFDVLSHSIAGQPWVNHEWLFQVIVYNIFEQWGASGLIMMQVVVVGLTMMILLILGYDKDKQLVVIFSLLLVVLVYQLRFTFRPDLFSLLFFALYIFILSLFIDRKASLYSLFFIQVLWSNIHGFFFFGPIFVLIGLTTEWVKRHVKLPYEWNTIGRLTDDEFSRLKLIFLFVILACVINPMTFEGAWYPVKVFFELSGESKVFFKYITELQKPILLNDMLSLHSLPYFKLLILISFISFVYNRRNIDVGVLFFWSIFLVFSLNAIRNIPFFAFAAYLVIVTNALSLRLEDIMPFKFYQKRFQMLTEVVLKIMLIIWMFEYGTAVSMRGYFDFDKFERKSEREGISQRIYPDKAVDFLVENKIKGNMFNDFNSGAYLVGRTHPDIKVFIDGRTEVYGPKFFETYRKIYDMENFELFKIIAEDLDITFALINTVRSFPKKLLRSFYEDKEWLAIYFNYDAVIFMKDIPENKEIIDKFAIDFKKWKREEMDLIKLGAKRVTPYRYLNRAYNFEAMKLYDAAIAEAEEAIKIDPGYPGPYKILGKVYGVRKNYKKSFENFRIASLYETGNRNVRYNLALSYFDMKEYEGAVHQYKKLIKHRPKDPKAHFLIARAYLKNKELSKSMEALTKAHELQPENVNDLLNMGELYFKDDKIEEAKLTMDMALKTEKKQDEVHNKLGRIYEVLGEKEKAKAEYNEALEINPDNEKVKKNLKKL